MSYYSDAILNTPGLLAYYRGDESAGPTASDFSGNGYPGTYSTGGGGTITYGQTGLVLSDSSTALLLSGGTSSGGKLVSSVLPLNSNIWTFEGWARRDDSAANHCLFGSSLSGADILFRFTAGGNNISFWPNASGGNFTWAAGTGINVGAVFHWALIFDPTVVNHTAELFINGVSKGQIVGTTQQFSAISGFFQFGSRHTNTEGWTGLVDEMAIYKGALPASTIAAHYNFGITTTFATAPAVTNKILNPSLPTVDWKFFLANSSTMSYIGDITNTHDKNLNVALNNGGTFSARINHDHPVASYVNPITTCVVAVKNGNVVWSGPVWTIEDVVPDKNCNISCVGWFELLLHRLILADTTFTSTDAGSIAQQLINTTNAVSPTGITIGSIETTQVRTKAYKKFQNIGQEIQNLTEIESGFDWYIDPATKVFSVYAQKMVTRANIVFGYRWGPHNLSSVSKSTDSSTLVNSMYATGASTTFGPSNDLTSQSTYGLFQEDASLSEVVNTTILGAFANAEIAIRAAPRIIYRIVPLPITSSGQNFSLFEDYTIGDKIYFNCNYGRINTGSSPQAIRVFSTSISIDDDGVERISELQASP